MDTEFINVYIQKQKSFIEELVAKNLILEAKVTVTEMIAGDLTSKIQKLEQQIMTLQEKKAKVANT